MVYLYTQPTRVPYNNRFGPFFHCYSTTAAPGPSQAPEIQIDQSLIAQHEKASGTSGGGGKPRVDLNDTNSNSGSW